ncbi:MAG: tRNA lysidine(34) synthetase TilS [Pseudomonadota bacterium]
MKPGGAREFDSRWLQQRLAALLPASTAPRYCVAWSGGLDSTVLLHALVAVRTALRRERKPPIGLRAIHVDHHLQPASRKFREHCATTARRWRVPLTVADLLLSPQRGESVEQVARDARYAALAASLRPGEVLLTAQHETDQLETVLLQLLRGAGVAGLAAMAESQSFAGGWMQRPLLPLDRGTLQRYAIAQAVGWVDDPSNADSRFDRNYLRARVLPPLLERWPAGARTTARSARLAAEVSELTQRQAQRDCAAAADGEALELPMLRRLAPARLRAALRGWIVARGLPLPDEKRLQQVQAMIRVRADASPRVLWPGACIRRHQDRLLATAAQAVAVAQDAGVDTKRQPVLRNWRWSRQPCLSLPGGSLQLVADPHGDVDLAQVPESLAVGWPAGGERLRLQAGHRDVKELLREAGVPSWERSRVPLVSAPAGTSRGSGPTLLAVGDLFVARSLQCGPATRRRGRFVWQPE